MKIYTIRDVAQLAGVSVTTVSRVLNHRPDVNKETREKVEQVMAECHFVGNANARGLKQADTELVAIVIRGRENPFLSSLAESLTRCAADRSFAFLTEYIDEKDDEFQTALRLFQEKRVTGFIFVGSRIDERSTVLESIEVPIVFLTVNARGTALTRASSVSVDDRLMSCAAVTALLERGHRRIGVFGGNREGNDSLALRYAGVQDAFRSAGLRFDDARFAETRFTLHDAYDTAVHFIASHPDTTAIFCMSDTVALGVMRALTDLGLSVPKDVSVLGFDGTEMGKYSIPRLSTVEQPVEELARQSIHVLTGMMTEGISPHHVTVDAAVCIRESVR